MYVFLYSTQQNGKNWNIWWAVFSFFIWRASCFYTILFRLICCCTLRWFNMFYFWVTFFHFAWNYRNSFERFLWHSSAELLYRIADTYEPKRVRKNVCLLFFIICIFQRLMVLCWNVHWREECESVTYLIYYLCILLYSICTTCYWYSFLEYFILLYCRRKNKRNIE